MAEIVGIREEKSLWSFQVAGKMTAIKTKNSRVSWFEGKMKRDREKRYDETQEIGTRPIIIFRPKEIQCLILPTATFAV